MMFADLTLNSVHRKTNISDSKQSHVQYLHVFSYPQKFLQGIFYSHLVSLLDLKLRSHVFFFPGNLKERTCSRGTLHFAPLLRNRTMLNLETTCLFVCAVVSDRQ